MLYYYLLSCMLLRRLVLALLLLLLLQSPHVAALAASCLASGTCAAGTGYDKLRLLQVGAAAIAAVNASDNDMYCCQGCRRSHVLMFDGVVPCWPGKQLLWHPASIGSSGDCRVAELHVNMHCTPLVSCAAAYGTASGEY
jgi:hypothetical protein